MCIYIYIYIYMEMSGTGYIISHYVASPSRTLCLTPSYGRSCHITTDGRYIWGCSVWFSMTICTPAHAPSLPPN